MGILPWIFLLGVGSGVGVGFQGPFICVEEVAFSIGHGIVLTLVCPTLGWVSNSLVAFMGENVLRKFIIFQGDLL